MADYFETYVERDVRRLGEIRNLSNFRRFVRLCAGRVGQLINLSSLGADAGVSHTTAREWLTVLEASYILFQLPPYFANIRKRLVKSPKFYFCDVGLAAYLVGIENAEQVATHPLRGALFENAVVGEALKHRFNRGHQPNLSFFRDSKGSILRTVFKQCYWRWLHSHKGPGTEGLNFSKLYPWAKCREIRSSRCWLKVWPLQTDHSRPWQGFTVLLTRFQFTQGESTR